ncbi:MAG: dicarboxylate/amino acid:cation symporter [Chitinophagaceae bacterium]
MKKKSNKLTLAIFIACILGIITGYVYREIFKENAVALNHFYRYNNLLTEIFLRLIKMIIGVLVFTTLTAGVAKLGDMKSIGRIGLKTLSWFIGASILSLTIGLVLVHLFNPSLGDSIKLPDSVDANTISTQMLSIEDMVRHIVPNSFFKAMSDNEILQIIVFSLFFSIACISLGNYSNPIVDFLDRLSHIILKMTFFIMYFAPIAVFGALASVISDKGLSVLGNYGFFIIQFYIGLIILWIVLLGIAFLLIKKDTFSLLKVVKEPALLAFTTASSEAAFPQLLEGLGKSGCSPKISSFVLPLGYSFNLDGSMMYMTFASIFIARAYGIDLPLNVEIIMLFTLMLTSKGIAGVPRASLVVIAATLTMFNLPAEGILLLLPIDHFLDMGRSATNILGNAIATKVIDKWEK